MTNEELEQKVKRLEEQLTEIRIEMLERKASFIPYKPYEVEVPEDIDDYYYVDELGDIHLVEDIFHETDYERLYLRGLAFKTKEEAEQFDKERILINKLKEWGKEHNKGWIPNWKDFDEEKNSVIYDNEHENFKTIENYYYQEIIKLPYFKSEEIAEQFIDEFGKEIKEVLY